MQWQPGHTSVISCHMVKIVALAVMNTMYVCMYEENRQTFACSYYSVSLVHKLVYDIACMPSHIFSVILLEYELKYKLLHINEKVL